MRRSIWILTALGLIVAGSWIPAADPVSDPQRDAAVERRERLASMQREIARLEGELVLPWARIDLKDLPEAAVQPSPDVVRADLEDSPA